MILIKTLLTGCILGLLLAGCTSLGHETRSNPKISIAIKPVKEFDFDSDNNELSAGIKDLLISRGYKVNTLHGEVSAHYVLRVRSDDLDTCLPEGSRQMHFNVTAIDSVSGEVALQITGNYGCKNTIIKRFDEWLTKSEN